MNITAWLEEIDHWVWGLPLIILLAGTGIYFSLRLGFLQIRYLPRAFYYLFKREDQAKGDVSPFASLCTALAATIGTGNIVGVATAIQIGGAGAIFWMWVVAFFGMATKYAECLLALKYRIRDKQGLMAGGPMYYIERGLEMKWLAQIFAIFGILVSLFGIGTFPQINAITEAMQDKFNIPILATALAVTTLVAMIVLGGVKRIATVSAIVVPFMALLYVGISIFIILKHWQYLPATLGLIFNSAFSPQATLGGVTGYTLLTTIQVGVSRGIFSNEAGLGSAPIAAAAAETKDPARQGLISMTGTFLDTIIVCTMTGLVIIISGAYKTGLKGASVTNYAFSQGLGSEWGATIVTIGLLFFAFTTILGWCYYGERCFVYLIGAKGSKYYRKIFIVLVGCGAFLHLDLIWILADIFNGLMAVPNLIALIGLRQVVLKESREFFLKLN